MKKTLCLLLGLVIAGNASAQTVIIVNNNDSRPVDPAPVQVTVANQAPADAGNYYYREISSPSSGVAITAGVTTAVVGTLLLNNWHHYKHKRRMAPIPPKHVPLPPRRHWAYGNKGETGHHRKL